MRKELFRAKALTEIASPEQLHQYVGILGLKAWIPLLALCLLVGGCLLWAFTGSIISAVTAEGIIFPQQGRAASRAVVSGRVSDVRVRVGDYVQVGDVIAVIPQPELLAQIDELLAAEEQDAQAIAALRQEYQYQSMATSPYAGRVMSVIQENTHVQPGDELSSILMEDENYNDREVIAYLPLSVAQRLEIGMDAQVSPNFAPREEYGYMVGYISRIGVYPVSRQDVENNLGSFAFEYDRLGQTVLVEVRITLLTDDATTSRIKWSSAKGSLVDVDIGTVCGIQIVTDRSRMMDLILRIV